jgi:hypothetical protein
VGASQVGVTGIGGARVTVVTILDALAQTRTATARIRRRTQVLIIAGRRVGDVDAPHLLITGIVCTDVAVIAIDLAGGQALPVRADVPRGAGVEVGAGYRVAGVLAAFIGIAGIVGTGVAVVAGQGPGTGTLALVTDVYGSARVAIVAGPRHGGIDTPRILIAAVLRAHSAVVTGQFACASTEPLGTHIPGGAGIEVIAGDGIELVKTPLFRVTPVVGAFVTVLAVQDTFAETLPARAEIFGRTGIVVIAGNDVVGEDAAGLGITNVVGAKVIVIAYDGNSSGANALGTHICLGTCVQVVARQGIVAIEATGIGIAGVGGADVVVVTV